MSAVVIHPVYFGNIAHFTAIVQAESVTFEMFEHYQKQTFRNRCYIATANGSLLLNIPIKHSSSGKRGERDKKHQFYRDVKIENAFPWKNQHWKSIQIAYRSSPFFEFYEDDLAPLFEGKDDHLLAFNQKCFEVICDLLGLKISVYYTTSYQKSISEKRDLRSLVEAKNTHDNNFEPYTQVLEAQHGFLPNLSILDLLFNEGPNALAYLRRQTIA
ncbi:MAG TPA: WbqC family protein [Flavobacteriaceae bacterium]|nr:WbqC family protein [Flavobacteriaceae bacterium]